MHRNTENIVAGGAVLGISALLFTQVLPGQFAGVELARNPMTFPRFLLGIFALGGGALLLSGLFAKRKAESQNPNFAWGRTLMMVVVAIAYLAGFGPLGFIPMTSIFLPISVMMLGYRNPLVIVMVTLITVIGLWYVFAEGFGIRPPGVGMDDIQNLLVGTSDG